ncbi:MAG: protein translocase subunit SecDF, partial [Paludibacteraceae bacterium]|nr:protein translocase subunit SecDF [Paludibacteraceae bacterium]
MQNKGFVKLFSVLLALVCIFYLSFTAVTNYYSDKAEEILQQEGNDAYAEYMDSISHQKVWLGYTLKQCREKEINLGLDLKGGMNVTLEVSVADILEVLSDHNSSPIFKQALQQAKQRQLKSQESFLVLFKEEFEKIDPNAQLSTIFSTFNLKDKIQLTTSNEEVVNILAQEVESAIDNSFNVIRNRIDRFGVVQPNIQRLGDAQGRIMVELPGIKEPERVRKLLQGSANLEFWETYELSELMPMFINANGLIKSMNVTNEEKTEEFAETETIEVEKTADSTNDIEELLADTLENKEEEKSNEELYEEFKKENPLFAVLNIYSDGGQVRPGPAVGAALATDTAKVNSYLQTKQVKELFPRDLSLKWTVKSIADENSAEVFELVAIKVTNREGRAPLEGDVITDANADFDQYSSASRVHMRMNAEGSKVWARLTKENIGKCIAIVLDDY